MRFKIAESFDKHEIDKVLMMNISPAMGQDIALRDGRVYKPIDVEVEEIFEAAGTRRWKVCWLLKRVK